MGFFSKKKKKGLSDDIKSIKRRYITLKSMIEEEPHRFGKSDIERLLHYESELTRAGIKINKFKSTMLQTLQQPSFPAQSNQPLEQFNMPGQPMFPSQMSAQQAGVEQVTTHVRKWTDASMNEPFIEQEHRVNLATGQETKTTGSVITVCGKNLPADKIAGFCRVCNRAVCNDHAKYCEGYENQSCGLIICSQHIQYFEDSEGNRIPCCPDHYEMRYYYQRV